MQSSSNYHSQGFQIFKNAIPAPLINDLLVSFAKVVRRKSFLYYSQSTHRWLTPHLSKNGFLTDSILNPSLQVQAPFFSHFVKQVIYSQGVYNALCAVSNDVQDFVSWQDMAFDQSTGTIDHFDSWYLDTEKPGGVIGAWIALEDISPESGPFFVCPRSHLLPSVSKADIPDHDQFLSLIQSRIIDNNLERIPILLKKGDVLLWNSLLIHGAFTPSSTEYSRKSLTSHFYPLGKRRNDCFLDKNFLLDLRRLKPTCNSRIFRLIKPGRSPAFYALGGPILALKDRFGMISSSAWNMRR